MAHHPDNMAGHLVVADFANVPTVRHVDSPVEHDSDPHEPLPGLGPLVRLPSGAALPPTLDRLHANVKANATVMRTRAHETRDVLRGLLGPATTAELEAGRPVDGLYHMRRNPDPALRESAEMAIKLVKTGEALHYAHAELVRLKRDLAFELDAIDRPLLLRDRGDPGAEAEIAAHAAHMVARMRHQRALTAAREHEERHPWMHGLLGPAGDVNGALENSLRTALHGMTPAQRAAPESQVMEARMDALQDRRLYERRAAEAGVAITAPGDRHSELVRVRHHAWTLAQRSPDGLFPWERGWIREHAVRARRRLGLSDDPSEPEGVPPPPPPST